MPASPDENEGGAVKGPDLQGGEEQGVKEETCKTDWVLGVCPIFQVPRSPSNEEVMFLTIQVKGPTQEFKRRTTVVVKNQESLVFVQTDKPIYKPDQTGTKRPYSQNNSKKGRPSGPAFSPKAL